MCSSYLLRHVTIGMTDSAHKTIYKSERKISIFINANISKTFIFVFKDKLSHYVNGNYVNYCVFVIKR